MGSKTLKLWVSQADLGYVCIISVLAHHLPDICKMFKSSSVLILKYHGNERQHS